MLAGNLICLLFKVLPAADGIVHLRETPVLLVTCINPSALTGLAVFKVQVERMFTNLTCGLKHPHSKLSFYVHKYT